MKRELILKEEGQEYAKVVRMLGNGRLEAECQDGKQRLGHIRGKMRKKVWINQGDVILLSLRDYQDEKGDVIQKYNPDETRDLRTQGEISFTQINDTEGFVIHLVPFRGNKKEKKKIDQPANTHVGTAMRLLVALNSFQITTMKMRMRKMKERLRRTSTSRKSKYFGARSSVAVPTTSFLSKSRRELIFSSRI